MATFKYRVNIEESTKVLIWKSNKWAMKVSWKAEADNSTEGEGKLHCILIWYNRERGFVAAFTWTCSTCQGRKKTLLWQLRHKMLGTWTRVLNVSLSIQTIIWEMLLKKNSKSKMKLRQEEVWCCYDETGPPWEAK